MNTTKGKRQASPLHKALVEILSPCKHPTIKKDLSPYQSRMSTLQALLPNRTSGWEYRNTFPTNQTFSPLSRSPHASHRDSKMLPSSASTLTGCTELPLRGGPIVQQLCTTTISPRGEYLETPSVDAPVSITEGHSGKHLMVQIPIPTPRLLGFQRGVVTPLRERQR